mmetsp:Transcript_1459/g.3224  ORF Transcript_1459/g.3224 Transcript_1459/m.3224 type:complete len:273 (+) Transcript_1459:237-1055(+)
MDSFVHKDQKVISSKECIVHPFALIVIMGPGVFRISWDYANRGSLFWKVGKVRRTFTFLVAVLFVFIATVNLTIVVDVNMLVLVGIGCRQFLFHCPQFGCQFGILFQLFDKIITIGIDFVFFCIVDVDVVVVITAVVQQLLTCRLDFGQIVHESHPDSRFFQFPLFSVPFLLPPQLLLGHFSTPTSAVVVTSRIVRCINIVVVVCLPRGKVFGEFPLFLFLGGDFLHQDHVLQDNAGVQDLFQSHNTRCTHEGGTLFGRGGLVNGRVQAGGR